MGFTRRVPLAWRILSLNKAKLALLLAGIAFTVLLMFMQLGLYNGYLDSMTRIIPLFNADLIMINRQRPTIELDVTFQIGKLYQAKGFAGVKSVVPVYAKPVAWKVAKTGKPQPLLLFAADGADPIFLDPAMGRLQPKLELPGTIVFDSLARDYYGPHGTGTAGELGGHRVHVIGEIPIGTNFGTNGSAVASSSTFFTIMGGQAGPSPNEIEFGLIHLEPGTDIPALQAMMRSQLSSDVQVLTKQEFVNKAANFYVVNGVAAFIFGLGTLLGFVIGVIVCYQILFTNISDNLKQFATLKAIGWRDSSLMAVVMRQAMVLSCLGFLVGLFEALILYVVLERLTGMPMILNPARIGLVAMLTVTMCLVAGLIALRKVSWADPADCF